jgi:hypothetical protein
VDPFVSLDLGKYVDFAACAVMTRELAISNETGLPLKTHRGDMVYFWQVRGLRRWPLRTPYSVVVSDLVRIATRPDINPPPKVVVDVTGVGSAVFEQVRTALSSYEEIVTYGISITAGESWSAVGRGMFNVSKVQITSCLAEALGCERVVICPRSDGSPMENADVLARELAAFRIRVRNTGYQTVQATGSDHDDCCIAISLPLWLGSQRFMQMRTADMEANPDLRPRELVALSAEQARVEAAEALACDLREQRELSTSETPVFDREKRKRELELKKATEELTRDARFWDPKFWQGV